MEGFEGLGKMLESGEEEEEAEYEDEEQSDEDEEEDKRKMLDELLDKMDEQYTVLEEAHKQQIEK